jgi:16S rRNA (guanine966-N2)-methyltransferase
MRVIAGTARGRSLAAPRGMSTRPMMDVVKGSLFNMIEVLGAVADATVLDLFAGSGSLGIEALSRGASHVDFVEQSRDASKVIAENLRRLNLTEQAGVIVRPVERFVADALALPARRGDGTKGGAGTPYSLVFMDAPYRAEVSNRLLERLADWARLGHNATICIGHHKRESLPDHIGRFTRVRHRCFGASCISIYRNEQPVAS